MTNGIKMQLAATNASLWQNSIIANRLVLIVTKCSQRRQVWVPLDISIFSTNSSTSRTLGSQWIKTRRELCHICIGNSMVADFRSETRFCYGSNRRFQPTKFGEMFLPFIRQDGTYLAFYALPLVDAMRLMASKARQHGRLRV